MPKRTKICRVCGAPYEVCRSIQPGSNMFNWRDVACSPECGAEYFRRIAASRSGSAPSSDTKEVVDAEAKTRTYRKKKTTKVSVDTVEKSVVSETAAAEEE